MDRMKYVEGFSSKEVVLRWNRVCSGKKNDEGFCQSPFATILTLLTFAH